MKCIDSHCRVAGRFACRILHFNGLILSLTCHIFCSIPYYYNNTILVSIFQRLSFNPYNHFDLLLSNNGHTCLIRICQGQILLKTCEYGKRSLNLKKIFGRRWWIVHIIPWHCCLEYRLFSDRVFINLHPKNTLIIIIKKKMKMNWCQIT